MKSAVSSGRHQRSRRAVLAVMALVLAVLSCAAAVGTIARKQILPPSRLTAWIAPMQLSAARFELLVGKGTVTDAAAVQARRAAAQNPLSYIPFLFAAGAHFRTNSDVGSSRDAALLNEALRRNPRSRHARTLLLRHEIGSNRVGGAIEQLASLFRLDPVAATGLLRGVGAAVSNPVQISEAMDAMRGHPELYPEFVTGFIAVPRTSAMLDVFSGQLPGNVVRLPRIAEQIVGKYAANKDYPRALAFARRVGGTSSAPPVADPQFRSTRAIPPFAWELTADATGVAERQKSGGVLIDYYGRDPGMLVRRLAALPAGKHVATIDYENLSGSLGSIGLQIACADGGRPMLDFVFAQKPGRRVVKTLPFEIPDSCRGQSVAIVGLPLERRISQQLLVHRLEVQ